MREQPLRELHYDNKVLMAQVISGVVQGRTVSDVCETLGIDRNRVTKWFRSSEEFRELLADTTDAVVAAIQAETVAETSQRLENLLPQAISVLEEALQSEKTSERVSAAAHIMRFSGFAGKKEPLRPSVSAEEVIRGTDAPATGD